MESNYGRLSNDITREFLKSLNKELKYSFRLFHDASAILEDVFFFAM